MLWVALAALAYAAYYVFKFYQNVARYPRGPTPLPLIGNLHQVTSDRMHLDFRRFRKEFGNVFTVFLPTPVVVLADFDAVKEAIITKGNDYVDRPQTVMNEMIAFSPGGGVVFSNGENWRAQRRTAVTIMRDFGMGKNLMEQQVLRSVEEYLTCLREIKDKDNVDMRWPIQLMIANIINETLFGYRYKYNECKDLIDYVEGFNKWLQRISTYKRLHVANQFPFVQHVPILGDFMCNWVRYEAQELGKYIVKNAALARQDYKVEDEPRCFVQAYMQKMKSNDLLSEAQLLACCSDFFMAGQETTGTTLRWAMLLMAANQRVQDKLREEILCVVGTDRLPTMADKAKMPYTTAAIHEVQRCANILPVNIVIFRQTLVDTTVQGHLIPAGTMVDNDMHQIHCTDPLFENPEEFKPERYLSEDGKTLRKDVVEHTMPFGAGKRLCAGEGLARVELFIGLAATIQHYRIFPGIGVKIDLEPIFFNIHLPKPHKLRLVPLHSSS